VRQLMGNVAASDPAAAAAASAALLHGLWPAGLPQSDQNGGVGEKGGQNRTERKTTARLGKAAEARVAATGGWEVGLGGDGGSWH